jgi:hypothetical protein
MSVLLVLAVIVVIAIVPVMVGARVVHARNDGFGSALLAVIVLSALSMTVKHFVPNPALGFVASVLGTGFLLGGILGTTFLRGLAIAAITIALQAALFVMLAGSLVIGAAAH